MLRKDEWIKICRSADINMSEEWGRYRENFTLVEGLPKYSELRKLLSKQQEDCCAECNKKFNTTNYEDDLYWQMDHILPKIVFPELMFELTNLRLVCKGCNMRKGALFGKESAEHALKIVSDYRERINKLKIYKK